MSEDPKDPRPKEPRADEARREGAAGERPAGERGHRAGEGPRGEPRRASLRGLARRILFDEGAPREDEDEPELDDDEQRRRLEARALLGALLETGDKAKTETVRMVAREFRSYLEALELHKDLHHLLTNYSLEVKASIHLAPLDEAKAAEPAARVGLKRKPKPEDEEQ